MQKGYNQLKNLKQFFYLHLNAVGFCELHAFTKLQVDLLKVQYFGSIVTKKSHVLFLAMSFLQETDSNNELYNKHNLFLP